MKALEYMGTIGEPRISEVITCGKNAMVKGRHLYDRPLLRFIVKCILLQIEKYLGCADNRGTTGKTMQPQKPV